MKKMILSRVYIGFTIGFIMGVVFTTIFATHDAADGSVHLYSEELGRIIANPLLAFMIHSFTCGLLGMVAMVSTIVYEIEDWNLLKATFIHFLVCVVSFYLTAFFLGWIKPSDTLDILVLLVFFIASYVIIWLIQYLSYRSQIKEINEKLAVKKSVQYKSV